MMKFSLFIVFLALASAEKVQYDDYRVYTVFVENNEQIQALQHLDEHSDAFELWDPPQLNRETEILVPPHMRANFADITANLNLKTKLIIENFQTLIDNENPKVVPRNIDWTAYHRVADIYAWLDQMAATHPNTSVRSIGKTFEGRDIKLFSITRNPNNRAIIIESHIHAREWISSATSTWIINQLLTSTDATIQNLANTINWYFIPLMNPDGLEYTKDVNRNWRKNRSNVTTLCFGVDGNRNYAFNWLVPDETGNEGASRSPCSDTYAGPAPMSEGESKALDSVFQQYAAQTDIFFSFHSYGHYMLYPLGSSKSPVPEQPLLEAVGKAGVDAIKTREGINYLLGNSNVALYGTSGSTPDHAYGKYNIKLSYTVEMRGNGFYGNYGFVLPAQFIIPNALELWDGLIAMIKEARNHGYLN